MALSLILPQKTLEENKVRISSDHCYCATLTPTEAEVTQFDHKGTEPEVSTEVLTPVKCHPVSLTEIKERRDKIRRKLFVDENDVYRIERETVGQSLNKNWDVHRKIRITASKCHRIATLQKTTSPSKAIREILHYKKLPQTKAMKEGLLREPFVIEEYTEAKTINNQKVVVKPCGLFVSKSKPFLAASPDGLVYNVDSTGQNSCGLIEVKLVFLKENETLNQGLIRRRMFLHDTTNGHLVINQKHKYYYQIQQQMFVTEIHHLEFVVKGVTELSDRTVKEVSGVFISPIEFDSEFWSSVLPKLEAFYNEHILVELAYPRIKYGLSRFSMRGV